MKDALAIFFATVLLAPTFAAKTQSVTVSPVITEARGLVDFDVDGNGGWKVSGASVVLEKAGVPAAGGVPGGPIRRPGALAILKSPPLGNLTFTLDLRSTAPVDLDVRDVLLVVGYRSPSQFYYVHIARKSDPNHNGIFLVNNADRKRLDTPGSHAPLVDQDWHRVRLERDVTTGRIAVYFEKESQPFLSVVDKTLLSGRVGFGSFDETGEFRNITLSGSR